jgi:hypothetical protein
MSHAQLTFGGAAARPIPYVMTAIIAVTPIIADAAEGPVTTPPAPTTTDAGNLWGPRPIGGGASARLIDVSFNVLAAAGTSTATDDELGGLQAGGHDPHNRGFTFQQGELSLGGAVDPYFRCEAHLVFLESEVELEEGYGTSTSLPSGVQVKAGRYFTEFGRINPIHPHAWSWIDQPVIASRLMGGDGMRGNGVRVAWLTPLPWFSQFYFGVQNANDGTMASFRGQIDEDDETTTIAGRPHQDGGVRNPGDMLWSTRWENAGEFEDITAKFGISGLFGPNATGSDGDTQIYGADFVAKWHPTGGQQGYPFVVFETEVMRRELHAASGELDSDDDGIIDQTFTEGDLRDWGFYAQCLYGFTRGWAAGVRYDYATENEASAFAGRDDDALRDDRQRISPLLIWQPTHFSRLRLQYNYDRADHLEDSHAHSVWLGCEFLIGTHPAHNF